MSNGTNAYVDDLRGALTRRIARLEVRAAEYGIDVPPHVLEDLEQARASLAKIDTIPPSHHERLIMVAVLDLISQVAGVKRELEEGHKRDASDRVLRQQETDAYRAHIESRLMYVWPAVAANASALLLLMWLVGRRTRL